MWTKRPASQALCRIFQPASGSVSRSSGYVSLAAGNTAKPPHLVPRSHADRRLGVLYLLIGVSSAWGDQHGSSRPDAKISSSIGKEAQGVRVRARAEA